MFIIAIPLYQPNDDLTIASLCQLAQPLLAISTDNTVCRT